MSQPIEQKYRANVAGVLINIAGEVLMVKLANHPLDEWDFPKGGMHEGETLEETLAREIVEELGPDVRTRVLRKSNWQLVYEWPLDLQLRKGVRGQARVTYWVKYDGGEIHLQEEELIAYRWVPETELADIMRAGSFSDYEVETFRMDFDAMRREFAGEFAGGILPA